MKATNMESKVFQYCASDLERAEFFASGRAYETGIVAKCIEMEVARAFYCKAFVNELSYPEHLTHGFQEWGGK